MVTPTLPIETRCPRCETPYPLDLKTQKWGLCPFSHDLGSDVQCKKCKEVFYIVFPDKYDKYLNREGILDWSLHPIDQTAITERKSKMAKAPIFHNKPNELVSLIGGRQIYHSRSVAVTAVISFLDVQMNARYFAIEKRGNLIGLDQPGKWCLPCGYLDWNESGYDAARREVWEEIGLDLAACEMKYRSASGTFNRQPYWVSSTPNHNRQNVTLRYSFDYVLRRGQKLPRLRPGHACEKGEVADARWVLKNSVNEYDFAFQHNEVILSFK